MNNTNRTIDKKTNEALCKNYDINVKMMFLT